MKIHDDTAYIHEANTVCVCWTGSNISSSATAYVPSKPSICSLSRWFIHGANTRHVCVQTSEIDTKTRTNTNKCGRPKFAKNKIKWTKKKARKNTKNATTKTLARHWLSMPLNRLGARLALYSFAIPLNCFSCVIVCWLLFLSVCDQTDSEIQFELNHPIAQYTQ